jgi:hypothetical protein
MELAAMHAAHNVLYLSQNFYYVHFEINGVSCNLIGWGVQLVLKSHPWFNQSY